VIDALQTGDTFKIATPADWVPGGQVIIPPSVTDAQATAAFPQGYTTIRPYLRTVKL
jgi:peroxiredoxin (alkyl hydroperoxide reductase subunit C)